MHWYGYNNIVLGLSDYRDSLRLFMNKIVDCLTI